MKLLKLFIIVMLITSCSDKKVKPQNENLYSEGKIPIQESWNSKILISDLGKLKAIVYSKHLQQFSENSETLLNDMKVEFYDSEGNNTSVLTAKQGRIDDRTKNMYAIDSVVAVSDSGVTLKTEELMWRNKDQKIVTEEFVKIITENEIIEGYGFESDQNLRRYQIFQPVINTKGKVEK